MKWLLASLANLAVSVRTNCRTIPSRYSRCHMSLICYILMATPSTVTIGDTLCSDWAIRVQGYDSSYTAGVGCPANCVFSFCNLSSVTPSPFTCWPNCQLEPHPFMELCIQFSLYSQSQQSQSQSQSVFSKVVDRCYCMKTKVITCVLTLYASTQLSFSIGRMGLGKGCMFES